MIKVAPHLLNSSQAHPKRCVQKHAGFDVPIRPLGIYWIYKKYGNMGIHRDKYDIGDVRNVFRFPLRRFFHFILDPYQDQGLDRSR